MKYPRHPPTAVHKSNPDFRGCPPNQDCNSEAWIDDSTNRGQTTSKRLKVLASTWTPKVCKIIAFMATIMVLGLLFYMLLGFRYSLFGWLCARAACAQTELLYPAKGYGGRPPIPYVEFAKSTSATASFIPECPHSQGPLSTPGT